jgi:DNA-binding PadR family transcriptional regulator
MQFSKCACSGRSLTRQVRPSILAILATGEEHGYVIVQQLADLRLFGDCEAPDASGVYRVLKQMESEGLVTSTWDTEGSGPARRMFSLTEEGLACLEHWVGTLQEYVAGLQELIGMMQQATRNPRVQA